MVKNNPQNGTTITLSVPVSHPELFSHRATADLLTVLTDNPSTGFGIRELSRATDYTHRSVSQAVTDLEAVDLVETSHDGPKKLVRINNARLDKPADPVLTIPQPEFHEPVRNLVEKLETQLDGVLGVVLFGSVARGTADRQSDIDCFVLVREDQALGQQSAHDVVSTLHDRRYDGERYQFQVLVESVTTAARHGQRLQDIFAEGITLSESQRLRQLKEEVLTDG
jgi:predicted nucleotidyltransferase